jgi:hypothetical protein
MPIGKSMADFQVPSNTIDSIDTFLRKWPWHKTVVHPHSDEEIRPESPITLEEVLVAFEQQLAEQLYEAAPVELDEEDTIDAVFAEDDEAPSAGK